MINNSIENSIIGIDLAKNIMHLVQVDQNGKKVGHQKVKRDELIGCLNNLNKSSLVVMEACGGGNYWSQEINKLDLQVKLMKTKDVKIYATSRQKNDYNDALAICKAARDPELKDVLPKSKEEQDIKFLHKIRSNTIRDRVQKTNSTISSLYEYGYNTKLSKNKFCKACKSEVELAYIEGYITSGVQSILLLECEEIENLCNKEKTLEKLIISNNKQNEKAIRLQTIFGIGAINASCLSVAPMENYATPRDFSASLGLVPKQYTSGDKIVLGGISKQGDRYARTMLIQAARTIAIRAKSDKESKDKLVQWAVKKFAENKSYNIICVGLANKLARIAYAVVTNGSEYVAN
ncbi:IS110 family transposase [Candidatus Tisiphia endosymbiont of Hybos culiciformis]|uniref:IS110 family transposase n=1 Tax=Candidatus Tisiphia endosymbiont of Hybos culiciformis TaxID=3139331 RepID=UPI003CCB17B7